MTTEGGKAHFQVPGFLTIFSTTAPIILAILAYFQNVKIEEAKAAIDKARNEQEIQNTKLHNEIDKKMADIEVSKERIGRIAFVKECIPDLLTDDDQKRELTINIIRLTLNEEESVAFFNGLSVSSIPKLNEAGKAAEKIDKDIDQSKTAKAKAKELEGFKNLISENFDAAREAFMEAEKIYPSYHKVHELDNLLTKRAGDLMTEEGKKEVYKDILQNHTWKMPDQYKEALKEKIK